MKQSSTFLFAMMLSSCLFLAVRLVTGSGPTEARPLAKSLGAATINECTVRGRIESRTNGVYAVFDLENPSKGGRDVNFNYLVTHSPPAPMMSRRGPRPEEVKRGILSCHVPEGGTTEEVLVRGSAGTVPDDSVSPLPRCFAEPASRAEQ